MNKPLDRSVIPAAAHDAEDSNFSNNPTFDSVLQARLGRRSVLKTTIGTATTALLGSVGLSACGGGDDNTPTTATPASTTVSTLGFSAVAKSTLDQVTLPAGYTATVIYAVGDPLDAATSAYANDGTDTDYEHRAGDHHDGMEFFGLSSSGARDDNATDRGLLAMNHEATSDTSAGAPMFLHPTLPDMTVARDPDQVDKEVAAHGISVVEVSKTAGVFGYVKDSAFNRRITPLTPVVLSGPVAGNALVKTIYAPNGTTARGTLNNCGVGRTPWGTLLSGEENWANYFARSGTDNTTRGDKSVVSLNRYGRSQGATGRHKWETAGSVEPYARWNISQTGVSSDGTDDYRNELNTFGYIVEIDPYSPGRVLRKRTAMGRFAHESAACAKVAAGKPLVFYMGDDARGEYCYKFVTTQNWSASDANPVDRITTGDKYLDSGKLYVAKFNDDGSGQWIELNITNSAIAGYSTYTFADQADVLVNARLAADAVGATKMDRPEWCAVHPTTGEVYYTLTNNSNRRAEPSGSQFGLDAANPRGYTDLKGATSQAGNVNGHIIRLSETGSDAAATTFSWDVFLFGAQSDADTSLINLSTLTSDQDFSSPDGLWFSPTTGICWIQTDDGAYTDVTNCMMLAAIPGSRGDGGAKTLNYTLSDSSTKTVTTYAGATLATNKLARFLVGPKGCEITGCTETPDGKTLFINIQHPGEDSPAGTLGTPATFTSHWPGNAGYQATAGNTTSRPRSATIAITKNDGGRIGS